MSEIRDFFPIHNEETILNAAAQIYLRRMTRATTAIENPSALCEYLRARLAGYPYEVFLCLFLDARLRVIAIEEMSRGTISHASVYPREIIRKVLEHNATSVIFAHNHPSGTPEPSYADREITETLKKALQMVECRVHDHVVVAASGTVSMAQKGMI